MRGWFVAPATTNYRFYLACDDWCRITMGNISMNADNTTEVALNKDWMTHREWWETRYAANNPNRISEWISLTEGEHYYLEA